MALYEELTVGVLYLEKGMNNVGAFTELTDSTTGTAGNTLQDVTATPTQALINDNFASLNANLNVLYAALKAANLIA